MRRLALLPLFASLASAAVVGDYDPMPTSPACDKFCGAWTCASRYGSFYCHVLDFQRLPLYELRIRERVDALAANAALDLGERREHRLMVRCVHHSVSSPVVARAGEATSGDSRPPSRSRLASVKNSAEIH